MSSTAQVIVPTVDPMYCPVSISNVALAASLVVKIANTANGITHSGAGTVYGIAGYSTTAQFIQIHDTLAAPVGGAVPKFVIPIAANLPFSVDFGVYGLPMINGIFVVNSTTGPTLTAGAADTFVNARFM